MDALKSIDQLNITKFRTEFSAERINTFTFDLEEFPVSLAKHAAFLFGESVKQLSVLDYVLLKIESNKNDILLHRKLQELLTFIISVQS